LEGAVIFRDYIKSIRTGGHYSFTTEKAIADLNITKNALKCAIYKLKKKGEIISPAKGFYVIIPVEHQNEGCLPAEEFVPILMKHLQVSYYVCLLSAAQYHGASHQKPQVFQVMTAKQMKAKHFGKIKIEFVYKKGMLETLIQQRIVKTGYLNISSPELTIKDMLFYPYHSGGLNNIATVLSELIEAVDITRLEELVKSTEEGAWIQRLGYILENIEAEDSKKQKIIIENLSKQIKKLPPGFLSLSPELPIKEKPRNRRWMIVENTTIESDL
jgi:predicted transcriptional regulator of viral defense system